MLETLNQIDTETLLYLNRLNTSWLDEIMFWISNEKIWIPFYALIIFFLFKNLGWKKMAIALFSIALMVTLTDRISSGYFKPVFKRFRPTHEPAIENKIHVVHEYRGGEYGFVSSHAANTFGLAMFLWLLLAKENKKWGWMFFWAGIVSYSRVYLGVHYPLDVLSGALLGVLCALLLYFIYKKTNQLIFKT